MQYRHIGVDCLDACRYIARDIHHDNGQSFTEPNVSDEVRVGAIKEGIRRVAGAGKQALTRLIAFINSPHVGVGTAQKALDSIFHGVSAVDLLRESKELLDTVNVVMRKSEQCSSEKDLELLASWIDEAVPIYINIRRLWALV